MDEVSILSHDDERRLAKELCAQYDAPAFVRRARAVQDALDHLLAHCRMKREEWLPMARVRIGLLWGLAGEFTVLRPWVADEGQLAVLDQLLVILAPRLRAVVKPTSSPRRLGRTLRDLVESIDRFNRRWEAFLAEVDLTPVNRLRDGYNRYYLLEKECALRSSRLAREGFQPLGPVTSAMLLELLPLLPAPRLLR